MIEENRAPVGESPLSPPGGLALAAGILLGMQLLAYTYPLFLFPTEIERSFWGTFFQTVTVTLLVVYFVLIRHRAGPEILGMGPVHPWRLLTFGLFGGVLVFILVVITGFLVGAFMQTSAPPQPVLQLMEGARGWQDYSLLLAAVSLLAPWGEELYFRGVLFPALRSYLGVGWGIFLSSAIFAAMHMDPIRFLPLAAGGAGLAWLYHKTGSLFVPMMAHSLWNIVMMLLVVMGVQVKP